MTKTFPENTNALVVAVAIEEEFTKQDVPGGCYDRRLYANLILPASWGWIASQVYAR